MRAEEIVGLASKRAVCQQGGHRFDPGWLHHLDEGRTGPVPSGAGPSAFAGDQQARDERIRLLVQALVGESGSRLPSSAG
jgi:hypothetical protein